ncbi:11818_t:CDS:2, partial [Racocetra fulgida]
DNKTWLLEYLRYHWVPNNSSSYSSSNNNTLPPGSFINPLDYIDLTIVNTANAESNTSFSCIDNSSILLQLTVNYARPWNVNSPNLQNQPPQRDKTPTYSSQAVAVIVVIIIIFSLISVGCCIRKFNSTLRPTDFNRSSRDSRNVGGNVGGRVRRTASILVGGGGGLTRENS